MPVAARNLNPIYINQQGDIVGGEPGEDPHLRVPVIVKMRDDGDVTAPIDGTSKSIYPIESFGGECFGEDSRVHNVWDLVFRMLIDVLPR
jgi:hypothetical protein